MYYSIHTQLVGYILYIYYISLHSCSSSYISLYNCSVCYIQNKFSQSLSSLSVLFHQNKVVTDLVGVSIIASYLLCILVVHTTLPGAFSVASLNTTIYKAYPTILARQNFTEIYLDGAPEANPPHSILSIYDFLTITNIGVSDNMIYDIIPFVDGAANADVAVNATTISAKCGRITEASQTAFYANGTIYSNSNTAFSNPVYELTFGGGAYSASFGPLCMRLQSLLRPP